MFMWILNNSTTTRANAEVHLKIEQNYGIFQTIQTAWYIGYRRVFLYMQYHACVDNLTNHSLTMSLEKIEPIESFLCGGIWGLFILQLEITQ